MTSPRSFFLAATAFLSFGLVHSLSAAEPTVEIRTDFPGGNLRVDGNDGSTYQIAPDLRTSKPWFYWYFEAKTTQPGRVTFQFAGAAIGNRGPAVSTDGGKTWNWLGTEQVTYATPKTATTPGSPGESFYYDFTAANETVRFSVGFPYVQSNLDEFLQKNAGNPNLKQSVLATTNGGLPVELLQIGKPGPGVSAMIVTARSHACEALASYILDGFLQEAMSDSPAGIEFRKKYVLFAVPILDKDGVQAGDQGKNRDPHDHNRDYGTENLYPEVKAVQDLGAAQQVRVAIDIHCPALKGDVHNAFHWLGLKLPHISDNADELTAWMSQERPQVNNAPLNFLAPPPDPPKLVGVPFSWHFGFQDQVLFAITLESPYSQVTDIQTALDYGRAFLRSVARTQFIAKGETRTTNDFASFDKAQKEMLLLVGQPEKAEEAANAILKDPTATAPYRALANYGLAIVRYRQKQFAEAIRYANLVKDDAGATNAQKQNALVLLVTIKTANPDETPEALAAALKEFESFPNPSKEAGASVYSAMSNYAETKGNLPAAEAFAEKQATVAPAWQKAGVMLRIATLLDSMKKPEEAIAKRKEVVAQLRPVLVPVPQGQSIMLGTQVGNYFDALMAIPSSTKEEKTEAANIVVNYPTLPAGVKQKAQDWLEQNPAATK